MGNLPLRMRGQSPSHARAREQEKETAIRTGGQQTMASGALRVKGDVRVKDVLRVENKTTKNASFSVTSEHISKLEQSVAGTSEIPFMQIEINGGVTKFIVIPDLYFEDIIKALKNGR